MNHKERAEIVRAINLTAGVTGTKIEPAIVAEMVRALDKYPCEDVKKALRKCYTELKGRLALSDITSRMALSGADSKVLKLCPVYEPEPPALPPSPEEEAEKQRHIDRFKRTVKGIIDRCD
jgi:hypothetical protein